ncbi:MAG: hypothetical protein KF905_07395 [Flavobacteriales bacterium]|nr:hypothetical protein [Flavobacteriales bacterium]
MLRLLRWSPLLFLPLAAWGFLRPTPPDPVVIPSAFRWKNKTWLEGNEELAVTRNGIQRVYHKLLDIDWNPANGAHPVSVVPVPYQWRNYSRKRGNWTDEVELVPCIYITNNTFLKISDEEVDELAHKLLRKLRMESPSTIHGVMLDCDWSAKTKDRFFRLTRIMNDSLDVPLTATIRLHQYAQPGKTGVPPADRGMLMPYNVGKITEPGDVNSIFDEATAAPYFNGTKAYPLPLDIGLPAFSWGVQFRNGKFLGILHDDQVQKAMTAGMLTGPTRGTMQVTKEDNNALPQLHLGDEVRMERMTPEVIAQVVRMARSAVNSDTLAVAFFELGTATFQQLEKADVRAGFAGFGRIRGWHGQVEEEIHVEIEVEEGIEVVLDTTVLMPLPDNVPVIEPKRSKRP